MQDNPRGIYLYAAAFNNVSIVNNFLKDNGGILLASIQDTKGFTYSSPLLFCSKQGYPSIPLPPIAATFSRVLKQFRHTK
jgi:hypothetical protein